MRKSKFFRAIRFLPFILLLPACSIFADSYDSIDVSSWIALLEQNITYVTDIVGGFTTIAGMVFVISGIESFHRFGKQRTMMSSNLSIINPLVKFSCGVILLTSSTWIDTSLFSIFGNASPEANIFANTDDPLSQFYEPAMMLVRLIGCGVFIKMIFSFAKAGSHNPPPGSVSKGLVYFLGSMLCIHIQTTMQLALSFLGFNSPF